jgi:Domain of unknown function (DUF4160)
MLVVFRYQGFRFFFYSNEGSPREPVHVHVRAGGGETKLWLQPEVSVATSYGFDANTLRELVEVARDKREIIERAWNDYFGSFGAIRRRQHVGWSGRRPRHCGSIGMVSAAIECQARTARSIRAQPARYSLGSAG